MLSIELLAAIIAGIGNFILGAVTFFRNPKSATNKYFAIFTTTLSLYLIFNYFSLHQGNVMLTAFWVKTVMSIAVFINLSFYLLATAYPGETLFLKRRTLGILLIFTIIIALLAQTKFIFSRIDINNGLIQPIPGAGMIIFLLHTIGLLGGGFFRLIKKYKKSEGFEKRQLKILFFGTVLMFSFILVTNVILVLVFNISSFVNLLPIYTLILTGFVSYAIIQHHLFDLRILAAQVFTVIIWIILFSKIIVSQNYSDRILDSLIFLSMVVFGILLTKSVIKEVEQRRKLQELTEKLKAMDKQKDEFISIAAHELRTPLTAINGYISMLLDGDIGELTDKVTEVLDRTSLAADRMIRLINNLLDVGRIEEGRIIYRMGYLNLCSVVNTMFDEFRQEAKMRNIELKLNIQENIKDKVHVDSDRIHEVVGNLLTNAFKYTEKGSIGVNVTNPTNEIIKVEVSDTGLGIKTSDQKKLFQKYYRSKSSAGKIEGTGLGLYVLRLLVEKFGGRVGVVSEVNKGSTFWFELPLAEEGEEEKEKTSVINAD